MVGYRDTRGVIDIDGHYREAEAASGGAYDPVFFDGQVVGRWRRRQTGTLFRAEIFLAVAWDDLEFREALSSAAERTARFFRRDLDLVI